MLQSSVSTRDVKLKKGDKYVETREDDEGDTLYKKWIILNGNLHFLCSDTYEFDSDYSEDDDC